MAKETNEKGLTFDSKAIPGSVVVKNKEGRAVGAIIKVTKPQGAVPTGHRYFLPLEGHRIKGDFITKPTYDEIKREIIERY